VNLAVSQWQDGWWSRAQRIDSPNFGERPNLAQIDLLVIHSISLPPGVYGGPEIEALFTNQLDWNAHPYFAQIRDMQVSSHFVIRRDGRLMQFVSCDKRAWHAGVSHYRGRDNCNDDSIGIELEGLEGETFDAAQYDTLSVLCKELVKNYPIAHIAGHEDVAPGRKFDPGAGFDWQLLQEKLVLSNSFFPPARLGGKIVKKNI
jgi:AmpD protein